MISVSIPKDRIPTLIGKDGSTKKKIEKITGTSITIGDEIMIDGDEIKQLKVADVVKAVGRGFSPQRALKLMDERFVLDVIRRKGRSNLIKRLLSRVIGTGGKARSNIENLTGAFVSVYGRTVSIIGEGEGFEKSRTAVEMLLSGRKHSFVWRYLEQGDER